MTLWTLIISGLASSALGKSNNIPHLSNLSALAAAISSSEDFNGCGANTLCPDLFCPDGRLAPLSPGACCPDIELCSRDQQQEFDSREPIIPDYEFDLERPSNKDYEYDLGRPSNPNFDFAVIKTSDPDYEFDLDVSARPDTNCSAIGT